MTNEQQPPARYPVSFEAHPLRHPEQMEQIADLLTAGLPQEAMIEVKLQAQLTLEEFRTICGPDRSIVEHLSLETADEQEYGIRLHLADALEADYGLDSLQTRAMTALRPEGEWRAREAGEISPETAMFLLTTLEMAYGNARNLDYETLRERMERHGITIVDLAVNESPPPEQC